MSRVNLFGTFLDSIKEKPSSKARKLSATKFKPVGRIKVSPEKVIIKMLSSGEKTIDQLAQTSGDDIGSVIATLDKLDKFGVVKVIDRNDMKIFHLTDSGQRISLKE